MGKCILNNKIIEDYGEPYIIAEINSSHSGNMDTAKQMIDEAKRIGCDCVKFQSWSKSSLYSKTYYDANRIASRIVDKLAMSPDNLKELYEYCNEKQIDFSSTPYSEEEVDFLADLGIPFIKIASMELNNPSFLKYIAEKNMPMILSTGMGEMEEIKNAVDVIKSTGNEQLILLHCVSIYPAEDTTVQLNNIIGLREIFSDHPIGFSDHTLDDTVAIGAVALGAAVIEKHFTLSKKAVGMDTKMAMEPEEFEQLICKCNTINKALGTKERIVLPEEYDQRKNMRRSVVSVRNLNVGETISEKDICFKRPGTGVSPTDVKKIIGKSVKNPINEDCVIFEDDIK